MLEVCQGQRCCNVFRNYWLGCHATWGWLNCHCGKIWRSWHYPVAGPLPSHVIGNCCGVNHAPKTRRTTCGLPWYDWTESPGPNPRHARPAHQRSNRQWHWWLLASSSHRAEEWEAFLPRVLLSTPASTKPPFVAEPLLARKDPVWIETLARQTHPLVALVLAADESVWIPVLVLNSGPEQIAFCFWVVAGEANLSATTRLIRLQK